MPVVKPVGKVGRSPVYATKTGFKVGQSGRSIPPGVLYGQLSKSEARKIRKAAHAKGLTGHASAPREYVPKFAKIARKK